MHQTKIRPETSILMCIYAAVEKKNEAIGCLVPELQRKIHHGCGMHIAKVKLCLPCYIKLAYALVEKQLESRQRQLGKTAVVRVRAYIVSIDRKTTVHRLEAGETVLFFCKTHTKLSIVKCPHISLTCL